MFNKKRLIIIVSIMVLSGCAAITATNYRELFGESQPRDRTIVDVPVGQVDFWADVKPVLDNRCTVCHGCYDAPCQLKLTAIEGLERGANKTRVYHPSRLRAAKLTRLFEDGDSVSDWRNLGFFPVLNEYEQSMEANMQVGVMYRMLELKEKHPLPNEKVLSEKFTFGVKRNESCPMPETFDNYAKKNPFFGMPYGLPKLDDREQSLLKNWLSNGAKYTKREPLSGAFYTSIETWESILNQDSLKGQLVSRYIYEHLFLAHIYFEDISSSTFFKLVRSATPPGKEVQKISSRRPYDDPEVDRVYYRLVPELETIVSKSHMPYALNESRMRRWNDLFFDADFHVDNLPTYEAKQAANPFDSFQKIPMTSRYKFMLDEAQFTIMNYIKGPVCRGSVALNVIRDQFWVFFVDPNLPLNDNISSEIMIYMDDLELPTTVENSYLPIGPWRKYAKNEHANREGADRFMVKNFEDGSIRLDLNLIWDGSDSNGGARNKNAALTIFRHYDSATVEQGLIGDDPQTAWVISYPLLERIHYLLVAGYDVYGNVGHQLLSRLHMDFLRMEGEIGFLNLLPQAAREKERLTWYRGASKNTIEHLTNPEFERLVGTGIDYKTEDPKKELYALLKKHLGAALPKRYNIDQIRNQVLRQEMVRLSAFSGENTNYLAEVSVVEFVDNQKEGGYFVTILRNNAHLKITSLIRENKELIPEENTITIVKGFLGAYPNVFMKVNEEESKDFVDLILSLNSEHDYSNLLDRFGVRRTDKAFWPHSDTVHESLRSDNLTEYGLLDYNRLENR